MPPPQTSRDTAPQPVTAISLRFSAVRLRKHADYQRVYKASRKQFTRGMSYFFALRPAAGPDGTPVRNAAPGVPRIGLTVPKALGKAHDRNRIKRRLREAVRGQIALVRCPVDIILHPRRTVLGQPFPELQREVGDIFRAVQRSVARQAASRSDAASRTDEPAPEA